MINLLYHNYFYRSREARKQIKDIVDSDNFLDAKTRLETLLTEHENRFPDADTRLDFNYGEKIMINHALDHLNAVIDENDPEFLDDSGAVKHQSDIVKEGLLREPKTDYS